MRDFDYEIEPEKYLTPEIVSLITNIHEYKGRQTFFIEINQDELKTLLEVAKIQSTGASNRIEGIYTTDKRLEALVQNLVEPQNRSEQEITGYREVLQTIHESYEHISLSSNILLQLHKMLYSYASITEGGKYKNADNIIAETDTEGKRKIRFIPTPAYQTKEAVETLCEKYNQAINEGKWDSLILIPMFILDFLCIHPFNDGNGRMSRLITLLLFYKKNYIVGKYISLEMLIEKSKETYYEVLQTSSLNWHEQKNDYAPFIKYYLGILIKAYAEFENRVEHLHKKQSKPERIKEIIDNHLGKITKKEIMNQCPDISQVTVERTLTNLVKNEQIQKIGQGRATSYVSNDIKK